MTNLSYEETVRVMEKCQRDGIRVVATERKLSTENSDFGKKKSLFEQRRITKNRRTIKQLSNLKEKYPNVSKAIGLDNFIKKARKRHEIQIKQHKDKFFNIYYNKSRAPYMADKIEDIIQYRMGVSKALFDDKETVKAIENVKDEFNSQQIKNIADNFKLHEIGSVDVQEFKSDYCIHELPFKSFLNMQPELDSVEIPYGLKVIDAQTARVYFENKHIERYSELSFNSIGQINVRGSSSVDMEWEVHSKEDLVSFKTGIGDEEKKTYNTLTGKSYMMTREEGQCLWTIFKKDLNELAEREKKRNVVQEELKELNIFEELNKDFKDFVNDKDTNEAIKVSLELEKEASE